MGSDLSTAYQAQYSALKSKSTATYEAWTRKWNPYYNTALSITIPFIPIIKAANCSSAAEPEDSLEHITAKDEYEDLDQAILHAKQLRSDIRKLWWSMALRRPPLHAMATVLGFFGSMRGYEALESDFEWTEAQIEKYEAEVQKHTEKVEKILEKVRAKNTPAKTKKIGWNFAPAFLDDVNSGSNGYLIPTLSCEGFHYTFRVKNRSEVLLVTHEGQYEVFRIYNANWGLMAESRRLIK